MKAVILAGGVGSRLREAIKDLPKPMAPIEDRPFLEYLILLLAKWQIKEIILAIGYKGDVIKSFFGNGKQWSVKIDYSEENEPLGTGGALKQAINLINDRQFFLMNGDSFVDFNFSQIVPYHNKKKAIATIGLVKVNDTNRYGKVEINREGKITGFIDKNDSGQGLINAGVYFLERDIIKYIPDGRVSLESDILPRLVNGGLYGIIAGGFFIDIGLPQEYLSLSNNPDRLFSALGHKI